MIRIENTSVVGLDAAIRGMRNPFNSWDKSDSEFKEEFDEGGWSDFFYRVGEKDLELMKKLAAAGTDHRKYMRMIVVYCDITAPMYWWKEFDTYKVGTVRNSCSTMHTIADKEFTVDDFSHEHLDRHSTSYLEGLIEYLNVCRNVYLETKSKECWWKMIQLLPSSYNQKSTVMLNYEVLANIYKSRRNHKLDEWVDFCVWTETLPHTLELFSGKNFKME